MRIYRFNMMSKIHKLLKDTTSVFEPCYHCSTLQYPFLAGPLFRNLDSPRPTSDSIPLGHHLLSIQPQLFFPHDQTLARSIYRYQKMGGIQSHQKKNPLAIFISGGVKVTTTAVYCHFGLYLPILSGVIHLIWAFITLAFF